MPNPNNTKLIRMEIAKPGTYGANGSVITEQDIRDVGETFDGKCPISLGHYMAKQDWWPSWGNVENIYLCEEDGTNPLTLVADISINETLYEAMQDGFYKSWSISIPPRASDGKKYLHHLAFLGATPPKIRDLKILSFADGTAPDNSIKVEGEGFDAKNYATYSFADMGSEGIQDVDESKDGNGEEPEKAGEEQDEDLGKNDFADNPIVSKAKKIFNASVKARLDEVLKDKIPPAMTEKVHQFADLACESFDFADDAEQPAIISLFLDIVNAMKSAPAVKTGKMDFSDIEGRSPSDSKVDTRRMAEKF